MIEYGNRYFVIFIDDDWEQKVYLVYITTYTLTKKTAIIVSAILLSFSNEYKKKQLTTG